MSAPNPTNWTHLEARPKSSYLQLFIKGTRTRAELIYWDYIHAEEPWTPEQIASEYGLPLEAVQEAIVYCQSNPPEIEQDIRHEEALMKATGMNDPNYDGRPRLLPAEEIVRILRS
jgi:uncharacterized protein (DUF433 family)